MSATVVTSPCTTTNLTNLPLEIILQIYTNVYFESLFCIALTCKTNYSIIENHGEYLAKSIMKDTAIFTQLPIEFYRLAHKYDMEYFVPKKTAMQKLIGFFKFGQSPILPKGHFRDLSNTEYLYKIFKFRSSVLEIKKHTLRFKNNDPSYDNGITSAQWLTVYSTWYKNNTILGSQSIIQQDLKTIKSEENNEIQKKEFERTSQLILRSIADSILIVAVSSARSDASWEIKWVRNYPTIFNDKYSGGLMRLTHPNNTLKILERGIDDIGVFGKYMRGLGIMVKVLEGNFLRYREIESGLQVESNIGGVQNFFKDKKYELLYFRDWDTLDEGWWEIANTNPIP